MTIRYTANFLRQLKKSNVRARRAFKLCLALFIKNPDDLELNNHTLERDYAGLRSIDVTADYRAIYKEVVEKEDETYIYFTFA